MKHFILGLALLGGGQAFGDRTSFLVLGDWGSGSSSQKGVAQGMKTACLAEACDFVITVGDNFYPAGVASVNDPQWKIKFTDVYSILGLSFFPSLGNHDYLGNEQAQVDYSGKSAFWKMPSRYHRYTKGSVEMFAIDTENLDAGQLQWLEKSLKESTATWKFVYGHRPIYSYGQHGTSRKLLKNLFPILKRSADYYLAGHDHDKQVLMDTASGFPFLVCGTGHETRSVEKGPETVFAASTLGFCRVTAEDQTATTTILTDDAVAEYSFQLQKP